jgi:putative endopeptidase
MPGRFANKSLWRGAMLSLLLVAAAAGAATDDPAASEKPDFISANLDTTVSAGEDFFTYANGGWLKRNPIPPTEAAWGIDYLVRDQMYTTLRDLNARAAAAGAPRGSEDQKIGDFWRTAMDVDRAERMGLAPLQRELALIDAVKTLRQAVDAAFVLQSLGMDVFFAFFVDQDERESETVSVHLRQGGLGLPNRDYYVNDDPSLASIRTEYVKHIARMLQLLSRKDAAAASAAASAVMRFETELAKASRKLEDLRDPLKNYQRFAPADFTQQHTPSIVWADRLEAWNIRPEFIAVGQPEYFAALEQILAKTPVPVLRDYLRFHLVSAYAEYLGPDIDAANFAFYYRIIQGQKEQRPRWKRVLDAESDYGSVTNPIGMMVGRRFVTEQFPEQAKKRYVDMVQAITDAFGERIAKLDWMTEATKPHAVEKLAALDAKVGYPDKWPDHSDLVIGRNSYCENMMNIERWRFRRMLARFGKPVDRTIWRMTPQTYNAYYNRSNNEIVIPAAALIIPGIPDAQVDDAVAYGYAGASTIGHEITHGFDDAGRKFDAHGNLADWWTAEDVAEFQKRAGILVRQFDAYEPLPGFHINGRASAGENIADLGGVVIALDAFKKTEQYKNGAKIAGLTPLQRFFLGYAYSWMMQVREEQMRRRLLSDVHSPPKWRVLGPLSNVPDFYSAFDVTENQAMWRAAEDRANVW